MNLSPWFKSTEPPVRGGRYQVKNWIGHISYMEYVGYAWRDGAKIIPQHKIYAWRGVIKP